MGWGGAPPTLDPPLDSSKDNIIVPFDPVILIEWLVAASEWKGKCVKVPEKPDNNSDVILMKTQILPISSLWDTDMSWLGLPFENIWIIGPFRKILN